MKYLYVIQSTDSYYTGSVESTSVAAANAEVSSLGKVFRILPLQDKNIVLTEQEYKYTIEDLIVLLNSGIQLPEALDTIISTKPPRVATTFFKVKEMVQDGQTLSDALRARNFPKFFTAAVSAGERSGNLPGALTALLNYYKTAYTIKRSLNTALIEPSITIALALIVFLYVVKSGIPAIVGGVMDFGTNVKLPLVTRILYALSGKPFIPMCIILTVLIAFVFIQRQKIVRVVPVVKTIFFEQDLYLFSSILYTTTSSGVPINEGLTVASEATDNAELRAEIVRIRTRIEGGQSLSQSFIEANDKIVPIALKTAIRIGEKSGRVQETLANYTSSSATKIETNIKDLVATLPTATLIMIAPFVFGVLLAFYLPYFSGLSQMASSLSK